MDKEKNADQSCLTAEVKTSNAGEGKVLIVDDDPTVLQILEEALKILGYQAIACSSADKALLIFKASQDSIRLIITDQAMPDMSGDQLIKDIREFNSSVPIILCTGYADLSVEEWETELDVLACLKKPFTISALSEVLERVG